MQRGRFRANAPSAMMQGQEQVLEEVPLPGTALADELDKRLLVQLRDGRKILGFLRSFDQFANLVIDGAIERIIVGEHYCDCPLGLQLIRGENVVLLGEIDPEKETPVGLTAVSEAEIQRAQRAEKEMNRMKATLRCAHGAHGDAWASLGRDAGSTAAL